VPLWSEQIYATFSNSDGRALKVRFLKSSAALKIMAQSPDDYPISTKFQQQRVGYFLEKT
jgi:hypothetical protein